MYVRPSGKKVLTSERLLPALLLPINYPGFAVTRGANTDLGVKFANAHAHASCLELRRSARFTSYVPLGSFLTLPLLPEKFIDDYSKIIVGKLMVWFEYKFCFFFWLWNRKKFVKEINFDEICGYINHHRKACIEYFYYFSLCVKI